MVQIKSKKILTDAEKNRQAILNKQITGKKQGGVKLTNVGNVISKKGTSTTDRLLKGINTSEKTNKSTIKTSAPENATGIGTAVTPSNTQTGDQTQIGQGVTPTSGGVATSSTPSAHEQTLIDMGFSTGTLKDIQGIITAMGENTAEERVQKKKAQDALSGLSQNSGAGFINPFLDTSSNQIGQDITDAESDLFNDFQEEKTDLETTIERQNAIDLSNQAISSAEGAAASDSATAQFSQGREGLTSQTNPILASELQKKVTTQLDNANRSLVLQMDRRAKLLTDLDKAFADGKEDLASKISDKLAVTANAIQKQQVAFAEAQAQNTKIAFDFLDVMGEGAIANMEVGDIMGMTGLDFGTASSMQALDRQREAQLISSPEYKKKMADLQNANLTNDQRNFKYAQGLPAAQKDEFLNFAGKNPTFGFTTIGNKIYTTNPDTGVVSLAVGTTSGGDKIAPSGKFNSGNVNGKMVTLDESALFGLQAANGAANEAGLGGINVTSSTRDQKSTILQMASRFGVEVDPSSIESVNQAAATLRASGHAVADVGNSNHEYGLAVDIYPSDPASQDNASAQAYIAKMKPHLEANGYKQSTDPGDRGHFNFVGMTVFSDEQKAVMDSINLAKYTGTDAKSLAESDLTYGDLATFRSTQGLTPEQKKMADNVKDKTQAALNAIDNILDKELYSAAGRSALFFPSFQIGVQELEAQINTVVSSIALDEMKALKEASPTGSTGFGALSQKELDILTGSKGSLRPNMMEDSLKENLESIRIVLAKAAGISENDPTINTPAMKTESNPTKIQEISNMIDNLQAEGVPDEEIIQTLTTSGIDPSQFYNMNNQ